MSFPFVAVVAAVKNSRFLLLDVSVNSK